MTHEPQNKKKPFLTDRRAPHFAQARRVFPLATGNVEQGEDWERVHLTLEIEMTRKTTGSVRWVPREEWEPQALEAERARQAAERAAFLASLSLRKRLSIRFHARLARRGWVL